MKFIDLFGKEHSKALDYSKYTRSSLSRSALANLLYEKIEGIFPSYQILEEFPCVGLSPVLYMDFLIIGAGIRIAFEADGRQHREYTPHFHGSRGDFARAQINDMNKNRWAEINNIRLIRVSSKEEVDRLLDIINE